MIKTVPVLMMFGQLNVPIENEREFNRSTNIHIESSKLTFLIFLSFTPGIYVHFPSLEEDLDPQL